MPDEKARVDITISAETEGVPAVQSDLQSLIQHAQGVGSAFMNIRPMAFDAMGAVRGVAESARDAAVAEDDLSSSTGSLRGFVGDAKNAFVDFTYGIQGAETAAGALSGGLAGLATGLGILIKLLAAATSVAADFEWGMARIKIVAQDVSRGIITDMEMLSDAIWDATTNSVLQFKEVQAIMYEFAAAGQWTDEQITKATKSIVNMGMATGALENLDEVAKMIATSMHMFGEQVDDVTYLADLFTVAANDSVLTVQDLATALGYVGPIAVMAGQDVKQITAALMILSNEGFRASMAGRYLRQVYTYLADRTPETERALRRLGIQAFDAQDNFRQLGDIVHDLAKAMEGLTPREKEELLIRGFGVWAGSALAGLVNAETRAIRSGDEYSQTLNQVATGIEQEGAAAEKAGELLETFRGKQQQVGNQVKFLADTFAKELLPQMTEFLDGLSDILEKDEVVTMMEDLGKAIAAIGNAMEGIGKAFAWLAQQYEKLPQPLRDVIETEFQEMIWRRIPVFGRGKREAELAGRIWDWAEEREGRPPPWMPWRGQPAPKTASPTIVASRNTINISTTMPRGTDASIVGQRIGREIRYSRPRRGGLR